MTKPAKVSKTDKTEDQSSIDVDIADIPLPPPELDDELDNTPDAGAGRSSSGSRADPETGAEPERPAETLEFLSDPQTRQVVHELAHPFRWNGQTVSEIPIRRLTVAEVGRSLSTADGAPDYYDVYAAMTGYPAAVLRGLMADDGDGVIEKCRAFFPQMLRPAKD